MLPILIEETIHYSIKKMTHSVSYHEYNMRHKLFRTPLPPLYGIWHPCKYTVIVTYCLFFPLMVAFGHGIQALDVPVYAFPKVIFWSVCSCGSLSVSSLTFSSCTVQNSTIAGRSHYYGPA